MKIRFVLCIVFAFITVACASESSLDVVSISSDGTDDVQETYEKNEKSNLEDIEHDSCEENHGLSNAGLTSNFIEVGTQETHERGANSTSNQQIEPFSALFEFNEVNPNVDWIVEPTLDVDVIRFSGYFGHFVAGGFPSNLEVIVCSNTGRLIGEEHFNPSAPSAWYFVYDRERNLFGSPWGYPIELHQMSEFPTRYPNRINTVNVFYSIDPSQGYRMGYRGGYWNSLEAGAVAYGNNFVTDFIFDVDCGGAGSQHQRMYGSASGGNSINSFVTAVSLGGHWGLVDRLGNIVVPFEFEHLLVIDDTSAFAKHNGKYGILRIPSLVAGNSGIRVTLDGEQIHFDQPPVIQNGRTLVPLRAIFEALGADVSWNERTQTVIASRYDVSIHLEIGSNMLVRSRQNITLDVPAQIIGDRTLVPARAVAESFGATVDWDEATQIVRIGSPMD